MPLGPLAIASALAWASNPQESAQQVLAEACYACHGPDGGSRRANLRLDRTGLAELKAQGSPLLHPGSEILARVRSADPGLRMPPPEAKLELSPGQIGLLEEWIAGGGRVEEHWSYGPLRPGTEGIDGAIERRASEAGLKLAPPAEPRTWLRRAAFVLTGLPPDQDQLELFLADDSAGAHDAALDRLFASPRYGERMAVDWLDVARYADTYGYQSDVERPVWPWRDWVIRAFQEGMGYDEFVRLQLAGDLIPGADQDSRLATAFQRLHRQTNEGGSVEEEYRLEYVGDRTHTFGTAFLGLTLECARCHDHKFDPISQAEYYSLSSLFANIDESGLYSHFTDATPTPALTLVPEWERATRGRRLEELEVAAEAALAGPQPVPRVEGWYPLDEIGAGRELVNLVPGGDSGSAGGGLRAEGGAIVFDGDSPARFPGIGQRQRWEPMSYALWLHIPVAYERAVVLHRSKAWHDSGSRGYQLLVENGHVSASWIHFWPGDAMRVRTLQGVEPGSWVHVAVSYDGSSRAAGVQIWLDGKPAKLEVVRDGLRRKIIDGAEGDLTLGERFRDRGLRGGQVRGLVVFDGAIDGGIAQVLALHRASLQDLDALLSARKRSQSNPPADRSALADLARERDRLPQIMVMEELPEPRPTHILVRGSYLSPGDQVQPDVPAALPPWPEGAPRNRLGLAEWLLDSAGPLTARVAVNRLWQQVFGRGLVETPEDFGVQGVLPSHPELLDQLSLEFIDSGWDVRALLRRLLLSSAFRRSSIMGEANRELDPDNRLLASAPRARLSAEMLRDHALGLAGLLVERVGGRPVRPYQPKGIWKEVSGRAYTPSTGDGLYRRSLYTIWKRTAPPPSMELLDAAKRDVCVARRQTTNTPLQSLVLWNDPQFVEASRGFAQAMVLAYADDGERIERAFLRATGRGPIETESAALSHLLGDLRAEFAQDPAAAAELLAVGASAPEPSIDPGELAAWTCVLNTLVASDACVVLR